MVLYLITLLRILASLLLLIGYFRAYCVVFDRVCYPPCTQNSVYPPPAFFMRCCDRKKTGSEKNMNTPLNSKEGKNTAASNRPTAASSSLRDINYLMNLPPFPPRALLIAWYYSHMGLPTRKSPTLSQPQNLVWHHPQQSCLSYCIPIGLRV